MKRKEFLQLTTTIIGGITLSSFTNLNRQLQSIKIGLITDLHYADRTPPTGNTRFYNESLNKLSECVNVMNHQKVDFLIQLGDFKDQDEVPHEETTLKYLSKIENEFSRFNGPFFHVLGNHDHDSISKQQFLEAVSNWGFEEALNYYSFNMNGFHFIVLDANYTSAGVEYNRGNFDWKDTYVPTKQIEWLKKDLNEYNNKPTIVFIHQRLDDIHDNKSHFVKNAQSIREIFVKSGNVVLVLQGHYHNGALNKIDNIVYYTLKAAVEGSGISNNNYAILEIDSNLVMKITGFRKTNSQIL